MIVFKGRIGLAQLFLLSIWAGLLGGAMGVFEARNSYNAGYSAAAQLSQIAPAAGEKTTVLPDGDVAGAHCANDSGLVRKTACNLGAGLRRRLPQVTKP